MDSQQNRPTLDSSLQGIGAVFGNPRAVKGRRNTSGDMSRRLTEPRRKRSGGDNWSDARQHERDRGEEIA